VKAGARVDVVMTPAAQEFVGAITFEALTGRPVRTGLFDPGRALDHIKLAQERRRSSWHQRRLTSWHARQPVKRTIC
jgi:phosphopantothenoylcysteine synthetase/decarboxylase